MLQNQIKHHLFIDAFHLTFSLSSKLLSFPANNQNGQLDKRFNANPPCSNLTSLNSTLNSHCRNGRILLASQLFDKMPQRDVVSWNTILAGFHRNGDTNQVIDRFIRMITSGIVPSQFTFATVISTASNSAFAALVRQLHVHVIHLAFNSNVFIATALIKGYSHLGDRVALRPVFDDAFTQTVALWNALISGYMKLGCTDEAHLAFVTMPERNVVSWTSLVHGYVQNKKFGEARRVFEAMPQRNVISWTAMISGYEKNGQFVEAVQLFLSMRDSRVCPNQTTFSSALSACAGCSSLVIGQQVHLSILKSGLPIDMVLSSSLVDMYAKCGHVNAAIHAFEAMPEKNLVSWNSTICCYARHGLGAKAMEQFEKMKKVGIEPDYITFVSLLSACGHGGLVEEGERYFISMGRDFGIRPGMEHYACMVDLYGRAGQLERAEKLIGEMPFEPDVVVLGALLGACGVHSNLKHGLFAADLMHKLERDHPAIYSIMSKIYGDRGGWNRVNELKTMMEDSGAKKQKGSSWIEPSLNAD